MQRSDAENARRASRGQSRKVQSDASQTRRNTSPDMSAPLLLIVEDELAIQELIVFVKPLGGPSAWCWEITAKGW